MRPKSFMVIAGEASGDLLGAELVGELRQELANFQAKPTCDHQPLHASLDPVFFGAGGPRMQAAGVELAFDMTAHSVVGLWEPMKNYLKFRRIFHRLLRLALERQPDAIICIDFSGFNRAFAHAIKRYVRSHRDWFHDWDPKVVQYVSPQVWASREDRIYQVARDYDLLLSTFAFEKDWYAQRVPQLRVEFVGNPIVDRYKKLNAKAVPQPMAAADPINASRQFKVVLLPGSRKAELMHHVPILVEASLRIEAAQMASFRMVLPNDTLMTLARSLLRDNRHITLQIGELNQALGEADLAITKSGTITLECAYFGVPAVVLYKTSAFTYFFAKRLATVQYLAMPNLLAGETLFPEFIQAEATPEKISTAALGLLRDKSRRLKIKAKLTELVSSLGGEGASKRAARAVLQLLLPEPSLSTA
jgi:lipid-A-disaccharide synthase